MQHWDLTAANEGTRTGTRVLFSTPEARAVVLDLAQGEEMGDHQVRERALVHVIQGSVTCTSGADTTTCDAGTLMVFEPEDLIRSTRCSRRGWYSSSPRGRRRDTTTTRAALTRTSFRFTQRSPRWATAPRSPRACPLYEKQM